MVCDRADRFCWGRRPRWPWPGPVGCSRSGLAAILPLVTLGLGPWDGPLRQVSCR